MKAVEFVKKYGIDRAKDLSCRGKTSIGYLSVEHHNLNQDDLKQIVDAFELVEKVGGLDNAKTFDESCMYCIEHLTTLGNLKQAINLVEQCND